ncbi:unnamed protein product [Dibothriocephalus latus]|uniref:USP domain-containing protein n=1 Tax=Dibothriocephalus latus TaxID=60516 RepID=A0A3P7LZR3_DIBLA|nr:unnamed protein product [Dibothriocephalus latus]
MADRLFAMARQVSVSKLKRIIQELLILFSRLHAGRGEAVSSKPLTDSFGWNGEEVLLYIVTFHLSIQVFVHQDIQELNRLLFEQIEIALKNTGQQNLINDLYHGVLRTRFSRFTDLPPILTLSLSRFYYDAKSMEARKLDKLCSFPMQLDMADFVADNYTKEVLYDLFSVVIHVGNTACGGHYHAYIKDPYGVFNGGVRSSKVSLYNRYLLKHFSHLLVYSRKFAIQRNICP